MTTGISAQTGAHDLSDLSARLDACEALGAESIELSIYDFDIVVGGGIRPDQLARGKAACTGRQVAFSAHGPLAINFADAAWRLPRHYEVLMASLDVAAELGCRTYVLHAGIMPAVQADALEDCYARQREWLASAGDVAAARGVTLCVETMFAGYRGEFSTPTPSRLARELAAINHPNVRATIDFSHSFINLGYNGGDLVAECAALASWADHLHIHDSFGRQDDIWMFTQGERLAYGHGDLHLPVGWGSIPWDLLLAECVFPPNVVFNIELDDRYWHLALDCVNDTKAMAARARVPA